MGGAARLHHDLDLDPLDRERGEGALMLDLVDVGAEAGEQRRDLGERAGDVADVDAQAHEPADLTMPRSMISASTSGSMLPPQRTRPTFFREARRSFISAARPTAPAPSTTVFSISSSIRIACSMSSSETRTTSSTSAR